MITEGVYKLIQSNSNFNFNLAQEFQSVKSHMVIFLWPYIFVEYMNFMQKWVTSLYFFLKKSSKKKKIKQKNQFMQNCIPGQT